MVLFYFFFSENINFSAYFRCIKSSLLSSNLVKNKTLLSYLYLVRIKLSANYLNTIFIITTFLFMTRIFSHYKSCLLMLLLSFVLVISFDYLANILNRKRWSTESHSKLRETKFKSSIV